ncbi:hypothetical protein PHAVU_002G008000 [Phaseolus vulgaris]|uniref:Uncharacterized protein n=1 Tax=Phaseolus vulgaris TaxID=3885 RepID=V7CET0_PHAVU|nr:hypothetical protein PHAVU_002G008000g [Phaseolus vulgaris]ESW28672.1 hypothetical protein PHAVU_002G008000g [Phaseolus vulgaris]
MENKKKDQKHNFVCNQESQTNDEPQTKRKNAQPNVTVVPSAKINSSSPSLHGALKSNQQQQPSIVQWPYTPQNARGQSLAMHFPTQASPPGALNQWQQYPHLFAQAASSFWQSHPPSAVAGPLLGANVSTIYQPFTGTGFSGAPSSATHTLPPNMCYHYPFPGFPCPWDPSSYMAQLYQMQYPYIHSFPGALNFSSATPRVPNCLTSGEHSSQIGNITPPSKLSQKHQQLWEAQTEENIQLWSVINKLQAEVSDYKDQLKKLEEEVSSFKQKAEVATKQVIGTTQPLKKRGRTRQSMASEDALNESRLLAVGKKPAVCNSFSQNKSHFEKVTSPIKVILKKVGNKEITTSTTAMVQQENNVNILNAVKDVNCKTQINQIYPIKSACQSHVHQEYQGVQTCGIGVNANFGKDKDLKLVYFDQSVPHKVSNNDMGVSSNKHIGITGNGNIGLKSGRHSPDTAKDVSGVARQSIFHNGIFFQQRRNINPGWSLSSEEEDASEDMAG